MIAKSVFSHLRTAAIGILVAMLGLSSAQAATSDWADNEGGRMRLIALPPQPNGHVRAALQIEPGPGWITYWREPGDSGIPPQVTPAPGSGIVLERISYPTPKSIVVGSTQEIGYDGPVTLPIDLRIGADHPDTLDISAFIGLCKDICIPFQADLSLSLADDQPSRHEAGAIDAATAMLPQSPSTEFAVTSHALTSNAGSLSLQLTLPEGTGAPPAIYIIGPSGHVFFRQSNAKRDGKNFSTDIAVDKLPKGYDFKGKSWDILVVDGQRAMETSLSLD